MTNMTAKQEKFLLALLDNGSTYQAIKEAKISSSTAYRWLNDPDFDTEYRKMRREVMKQTTARLQYLALKTTTELEKVLEDPKASVFAKIQASQLILEKAYKGLELDDLEERIEALERLNNGNIATNTQA